MSKLKNIKKDISGAEQKVWINNIRLIYEWTHDEIDSTFSFSGYFEHDFPVYVYHEKHKGVDAHDYVYKLGIYGTDDDDEDKHRVWKHWMMFQRDSGWSWDGENPKSDRYPPLSEELRCLVEHDFREQFQVAFDRIDHVLSFLNINAESKNYNRSSEKDFRNIISLLLLSVRRISSNFPIEMVMSILSFVRICELRVV